MKHPHKNDGEEPVPQDHDDHPKAKAAQAKPQPMPEKQLAREAEHVVTGDNGQRNDEHLPSHNEILRKNADEIARVYGRGDRQLEDELRRSYLTKSWARHRQHFRYDRLSPALDPLLKGKIWVGFNCVPKINERTGEIIRDRDGKIEWGKEPRRPDAPGVKASHSEPGTWGSFKKARQLFDRGKFDVLGFALYQNRYGAGDGDHVRNPASKVLLPEAQGMLHRADTYREVSCFGTGVHFVVDAGEPTEQEAKEGVPARIFKDKAGVGWELYDRSAKRFFIVTGAELPPQVDKLRRRNEINGRTRSMLVNHAKVDF